MNMKSWCQEQINAKKKKALPVLSFPGIAFTGDKVIELVKSGVKQAACMEAIADNYDTAASLSLMDLSVEAECFGCETIYKENEIPTIHGALIHTLEEAEALAIPEIGSGRTGECIKGITEAKKRITDRPVFAGMIGPYSLAGRLCDMTEVMIMCLEEPEIVEEVLRKATEFLISYAKALKTAGADGIVVAEPAAGLLSPFLMEEFSNPYIRQLIEAVQDDNFLFCYHNCGSIVPLLKQVAEIPADCFSIGNAIDIEEVLKVIPSTKMVIGNIDPAGTILSKSPQAVYNETTALLQRCSKYPNFIIGSGCDIPPLSPQENIRAFFEAVQNFYQ